MVPADVVLVVGLRAQQKRGMDAAPERRDMGALVPGRGAHRPAVRLRVGAREALGVAQPRESKRVRPPGGSEERDVVSDEPSRRALDVQAAKLREHFEGKRGRALEADRVAAEGRAEENLRGDHGHAHDRRPCGGKGGFAAAAQDAIYGAEGARASGRRGGGAVASSPPHHVLPLEPSVRSGAPRCRA